MTYNFGGVGSTSSGSFNYGTGTSFVTQESLVQSMRNDWAIQDESTSHSVTKSTDTNKLYGKIDNFQRYIESGDEDIAMQYYRDLIELMKGISYYANMDDEELRVNAERLLKDRISKNKNDNNFNLETFIRDNTANAGEKNYQWHCTMWNGDNARDEYTEEDLLNEILGMHEEKSRNEQSGIADFFSYVPGFFASCWNGIFGGGGLHW